jgi:hypothetical protein
MYGIEPTDKVSLWVQEVCTNSMTTKHN